MTPVLILPILRYVAIDNGLYQGDALRVEGQWIIVNNSLTMQTLLIYVRYCTFLLAFPLSPSAMNSQLCSILLGGNFDLSGLIYNSNTQERVNRQNTWQYRTGHV